jgi:two-component system CheB/CheR fusion protein
VLIVEDEPNLRELLQQLLDDDGYEAHVAADGPAALAMVADGTVRPGLVLADYNLPGGMDGVDVCNRLREIVNAKLPYIILTGDISSETLRRVAAQDCLKLNKPVPVPQLLDAVRRLLAPIAPPAPAPLTGQPLVHVVDDDAHIRLALREMLEAEGHKVETHSSAEALLGNLRPGPQTCMLLDVSLPGISGIDLLGRLKSGARLVPTIMITGMGDISMAVRCMQAGAIDFIEKPISRAALLSAIGRALAQARDAGAQEAFNAAAAGRIAALTDRQREIMVMVLAGHPSKNIAADLAISQRTVENHRAAIMRRTATRSLPALARLALAAGISP